MIDAKESKAFDKFLKKVGGMTTPDPEVFTDHFESLEVRDTAPEPLAPDVPAYRAEPAVKPDYTRAPWET